MNLADLEKEYERDHLKRLKRLVGGHNLNLGGDPRSGTVYRIMLKASETISRDIRKFRLVHPQKLYKGSFYRRNAALEKSIAATLQAMSKGLTDSIENAMVGSWQLNGEKWDAIAARYEHGVKVPAAVHASLHLLNFGAMNEFINRKINGMNLSERVWNLAGGNKEYLELYLGSGIMTGRSAQKISQDIRSILQEPEKLFRRVRHPETGKLMLSEAAKLYHPGAGAYRSSYKNAMRLAVTETNMAYRRADIERRKQLPFVYGIQVNLSRSHPRLDICDYMAGEYPRDFVFDGWHPWCLCFTTSILADKDEFLKFMRTGDIDGRKYIRSIPQKAQGYVTAGLPHLLKSKTRPYWFGENFTQEGTLRKSIAETKKPQKE